METLVKLVGSLLKILTFFFETDGGEDRHAPIGVKASVGERKVVPFDRADFPDLGPEYDDLIPKAEQLYDDDDHRYKWMKAVRQLRTTDTGWIMDKSNNERKFTKWGLTHLAC